MNLIIKLTNDCNFVCKYCSGGNPEKIVSIEMNILKKIIDDLPELLDKTQHKKVSFIWHGGEPLLRGVDFLREIMLYAQGKLTKYECSFKVQTNGYLIDENWVELFKEFAINPGISLDGYRELHNTNRVDKSGMETFDVIMNNIQMLKNNDINIGVLMVLNTTLPVDVDELLNFISENNLSCKIHAVYPSGRAENRDDIDEVFKSYMDILKQLYIKSMQLKQNIIIDPVQDIVNAILNDQSLGECSYAGTCGQDFLCVFEDGGVSFCGRHANDFGLCYGYIQEHSLYELYISEKAEFVRARQQQLLEKKCGSCEDYNLCHGGCAFEAMLVTGDLYSTYPHCAEWIELINFVKVKGLTHFKKRLLSKKNIYKKNIQNDISLLEVLQNIEI